MLPIYRRRLSQRLSVCAITLNFASILATLLTVILGFFLPADAQSPLILTSPAIAPGATIPATYSCSGADRSPALSWSGAPPPTRAFALIVDDPDAPGGIFMHWVAYNIPVTTSSLPEGVPQNAQIPGGGTNGINGFGHIGYNGPCPPAGKIHHYHFRLYALDSAVNLGDGADATTLTSAMKGHIVASAELVGTFSR